MLQNKKAVTINSRKFDGTIHRSWKADLIEETQELITFVGTFEKEIKHPHLGVIRRGTISYEYYWKSRWFNIFRFHEPDGDLRNFYCNVNQPPVFDGIELNYVDLDIDVLVWRDFTFLILDTEEFEINTATFKYPPEILTKVDESLKTILKMIVDKSFPFNNEF